MTQIDMLIGGTRVQAEGGRTFERKNPIDQQLATMAPAGSVADARKAVDAAADAFGAWAATGPGERRALLSRAADALQARHASLTQAIMAETGASAIWADFNVRLAVNMLREAAALTTQIQGQTIPSDTAGLLSMAVRQPAGVVLGMAPWNAPLILGVRALAVPLVCGNTVVFKGSEVCPATHAEIVQAFCDAEFPAGVVNFVTNAPADAGAVVEAMIAHPALRRVNFTGSTRVGKIIAATCAKYLKPSVLELGGKAPALVLDDADLDDAVNGVAFGAFANSGQICMSTERIIVDQAHCRCLHRKARRQGQGIAAGRSAQRARRARLCRGHGDSGTLQPPDRRRPGQGRAPAVRRQRRFHLDACDLARPRHSRDGDLSRGVVRAGQADRAGSRRSAGHRMCQRQRLWPFFRHLHRRPRARLAGHIQSGICHVNGATVHDEAQMPFGGVKDSGWGRFGGQAGIDAFTDLRWVTLQTSARHYPF